MRAHDQPAKRATEMTRHASDAGKRVRYPFSSWSFARGTDSGVVIIFAVVVVVTIVLIRWSRRHEATPPVDAPALVSNNTMAAREARESPRSSTGCSTARPNQPASVADDPLARERIVQAAVKAMEDLRTGGSAAISLPFLTADAGGPKHFAVRFKRNLDSTFELQR